MKKNSMNIDLDAPANRQVPSAYKYSPPPDIGSIDDATHGGINSTRIISPEYSGTLVSTDNASFMDYTAQYLKDDNAELLRIRTQAPKAARPNNETPLIGRQDSDPKGG